MNKITSADTCRYCNEQSSTYHQGISYCRDHARAYLKYNQLDRNKRKTVTKQITKQVITTSTVSSRKRGTIKIQFSKKRKIDRSPSTIHILSFKGEDHLNEVHFTDLDPANIGPIKHGQPDCPDAASLMHLFYGSLCDKNFIKEDSNGTKQIAQLFFKARNNWFSNLYRAFKNYLTSCDPLYFVWSSQPAADRPVEHHLLDLSDARDFFSLMYELFVKETFSYHRIVAMMTLGHDIALCTNSHIPSHARTEDGIISEYMSSAMPDHMLLLYMILTMKPEDHPWNKNKKIKELLTLLGQLS
jgi:hypothetical protein